MALEVLYTPEFKRDYKKLPKNLRELLKRKGELFVQRPFHPKLRTHKLTGKLRGRWAFSLDRRHRVIFRFLKKREVLFLRVGDHSIYRSK